MKERYDELRQKLHFRTDPPRWLTENDLTEYAEKGRFWAEKIFDAILFLAKTHHWKFSGFLGKQFFEYLGRFDEFDIIDICEICLERLRPEVFFESR